MILPASLDLKGMCKSSVMYDSVELRKAPSFSYVLFLSPPSFHCVDAHDQQNHTQELKFERRYMNTEPPVGMWDTHPSGLWDSLEAEVKEGGGFLAFHSWLLSRLFPVLPGCRRVAGSHSDSFHLSKELHVDSQPDLEENSQKSGNPRQMLSFHLLLTPRRKHR